VRDTGDRRISVAQLLGTLLPGSAAFSSRPEAFPEGDEKIPNETRRPEHQQSAGTGGAEFRSLGLIEEGRFRHIGRSLR
jgi:hypothetical protein